MSRRAFVMGLVLVLGGCATTAKINYDADPSANFSSYKSYSWASATTPQGMNPLIFQRVKTAIASTLATRGYSEGSPGEFAVGFTLGSRDRVQVTDFGSYGAFYRPWGGWGGYNNVDVRNVTDGTLTIDIYDTRTKQPVWHGTATQEVSSKAPDQAKIDSVVAAVLANFPPPPPKAK